MADTMIAEPQVDRVKAREDPPRRAREGEIELAEYKRALMRYRMPVGHTFEDLLKPDYWALVAHRFQGDKRSKAPDYAGSIIEVWSAEPDGFLAHLFVVAVRDQALSVICIGPQKDSKTGLACPIDLTTGGPYSGGQQDEVIGSARIRWNVGARSYEVIRANDSQIVARNLKTRAEAELWIAQTMKAA